jgi:hypothetical protein
LNREPKQAHATRSGSSRCWAFFLDLTLVRSVTGLLLFFALLLGPIALAQGSPGPTFTPPAIPPGPLPLVSADRASEAPADTARVPKAPPTLTYTTYQWRRPLWEPYAPSLLTELNWRSVWVPVIDGGLGAAAMVLGEAGTSPAPAFELDGVPLGTGHILTDDPWLVVAEGCGVAGRATGFDLRRGRDGLIRLHGLDSHPRAAVSRYQGTKGKHESYHRSFSLLTPRAAWRVGFTFDENLDVEAYNFSAEPDAIFSQKTEFPGHSRIRTSRAWLVRQLDSESSLKIQYSTGRKTKDSLPALGAEHQEIWDAGVAATMESRQGSWAWRTVFFRNSRDVRWGDRPGSSGLATNARLLETTRSGVNLSLVQDRFAPRREAAPDTGRLRVLSGPGKWERTVGPNLNLRLDRWVVRDSGQPTWAPAAAPIAGAGQEAHLTCGARVAGGGRWSIRTELSGTLHQLEGGRTRGGYGGALGLGWRNWDLSLTRGGRAPRSDELLTPLRRDVNSRVLQVLPNPDLDLEQVTRLQLVGSQRLLGLDLALTGSMRRLRHGISWRESLITVGSGVWQNDLALDSSRLTASVGHEGRFLGWARLRLEGTWQDTSVKNGQTPFLAPEQLVRLEMRWENHLFQEDGILQIALYTTSRGEMADPWDLQGATILPRATWHDLLLGFRLVGADLGLAFRNFTDQRIQLSAGSWSTGREMEMRLRWTFLY